MRALGLVLALTLLARTVFAQPATLPLDRATTVDVMPGETREYRIVAAAGDVVIATLELHDVRGVVEVRGPADKTLRTMGADDEPLTGEQRVGFVAPGSGEYRIALKALPSQGRSLVVRLHTIAVPVRMIGVLVQPKVVSVSDRLTRLSRDLERGDSGALDRFWQEVDGKGPIVEPIKGESDEVLATFLWREIYETKNVLLVWPLAWSKADDYYMSRLAGSDVWFKTLRLRRGSRFTYAISPNDRPEDREVTSQRDPLNPRRYPEALVPSSQWVTSVFELPDAPDEGWFRRTPMVRGHVERKSLRSALLHGVRDLWLYTPAGYDAGRQRYPLVILFDGAGYLNETWNGGTLNMLDNLIADRRIRPAVVCFVDTSKFRRTDLGLDDETFGNAIATELLPMLRGSYAINQGQRDIVVGGYSAGGTAATLMALKHADLFGSVLSQSGNFRAKRADSTEPNVLARAYASASRIPVRFYLDAGLYDHAPSATLPLEDFAADETILQSNRHFRDVLLAKGYDVVYRETGTAHETVHFRSTLADGLLTLLPPSK